MDQQFFIQEKRQGLGRYVYYFLNGQANLQSFYFKLVFIMSLHPGLDHSPSACGRPKEGTCSLVSHEDFSQTVWWERFFQVVE